MQIIRFFLCLLACVAVPAFAQTSAPASPANNLGQPPDWPYGFNLPGETSRQTQVLAWFPPGAKRIRALFVFPNNTDSRQFHECKPLRKVAAKHEAGIVYLNAFSTGFEYHHAKPTETLPQDPERVPRMLTALAKEVGIPEVAHAPWITFGKSSRGEVAFRLGWIHPERTIAGITYHGESPTWPIPKWAQPQDQSILYCAANGQEEWSGTWYRHVRPFLLNYRAQTAWLPHQTVSFGVGHGTYVDYYNSKGWGKPVPEGQMSVLRIWDYLALFADKALTLRLPEKGYPTDGPLKLRQVDPDSGYLVHPRAVEELLGIQWMALRKKDGAYQQIPWPEEKHPVVDTEQGKIDPKLLLRKAKDVPPAERKDLFWIPDRELAVEWLKLHNVKHKDIAVP